MIEREGGMERIGKGGIYDKIKVTFRGNFVSRNQNNDNYSTYQSDERTEYGEEGKRRI